MDEKTMLMTLKEMLKGMREDGEWPRYIEAVEKAIAILSEQK